MSGRLRAIVAVLGATLIVASGCTAVLGVNDVFYDADAGQGTSSSSSSSSSGASSSSSSSSSGSGGDAAADGSTECNADLQTSATHCGRCNHDCGGGACTAGRCEAVTVAEVARVTGLATDGTHLYASSYTGGNVLRLEKAPMQQVSQVMAAVPSAMGIAVSGTTLYATNETFASSNGGVHRCTLPACADKTRITPLDYARQVAVTPTALFATSQDGLHRMNLDGSSPALIATYTQCFGLAADATHVYVGSFNPFLQRMQHDGGAPTAMGPRNASTNYGWIALDGDRVFWAYEDDATKKGFVIGSVRASPATRTTYTSTGADSAGVAADADNVYWSDVGTRTMGAANGDGTLNTCPRAGCPAAGPTVLATQLRGAGPVVLDSGFVYWAENGTSSADGRVRKVAKP